MSHSYITRIALLTNADEKDVLIFKLKTDCIVHLRCDTCQNEIKAVFSTLLKELLEHPIKVELVISPDYENQLLKEVCKEYIDDLNREIENVIERIPKPLKAY